MPDRFSEILVSKGIISQEQLTEATKVAGDSGKKLHEEILRLGYAPPARVMKALAKANRMAFTDLEGMTVPDEVIDLVPESVARENTILPLREEGTMLRVATSDPTDIDRRPGSLVAHVALMRPDMSTLAQLAPDGKRTTCLGAIADKRTSSACSDVGVVAPSSRPVRRPRDDKRLRRW